MRNKILGTIFNDEYLKTLNTLSEILEIKDPYINQHSHRVTKYSTLIARKIGFSSEKIEILKAASLIHDIGKIGISDEILTKPGPPTLFERKIIELHPILGAEILKPFKLFQSGVTLIRHHHERYDGTGYPDRLAGREIPLFARIIAISDAYDAMTSDRPYRKALTNVEVRNEFKNNRAKQFDPDLTDVFLQFQEKSLVSACI